MNVQKRKARAHTPQTKIIAARIDMAYLIITWSAVVSNQRPMQMQLSITSLSNKSDCKRKWKNPYPVSFRVNRLKGLVYKILITRIDISC